MHFQSEVVQILLIEGLEQREAVLFFMNFSQGATFLQTKEKLLTGSLQQRETGSVLSEIVNLIGEERKHKEKAVHKQGILSGAWQIQIVLFVKWEAWSSNGRYASSLLQTFNRIYHSEALTCVALPSLFAYHSLPVSAVPAQFRIRFISLSAVAE